MSITSAVATIIQAVSPELSDAAGATGAGAGEGAEIAAPAAAGAGAAGCPTECMTVARMNPSTMATKAFFTIVSSFCSKNRDLRAGFLLVPTLYIFYLWNDVRVSVMIAVSWDAVLSMLRVKHLLQHRMMMFTCDIP